MMTPFNNSRNNNRQWVFYNSPLRTLRFQLTGGGIENAFYDPTIGQIVLWNCAEAAFFTMDGTPVFAFDRGALSRAGLSEMCFGGFVGAGFDPTHRTHYMLVHQGRVRSPDVKLSVSVVDFKTRTWRGLVPTDATAGQFGFGKPGNDNFFESLEYVGGA